MNNKVAGTARVVALCLGVVVACSVVPAAAAEQRRYTVDDLLRIETVGRALTEPAGRWIVWEWARRYDRQPDYSINHIGAFRGAYRLMVVDTQAARPTSVPLFDPDPARQYWLDSISPDGRYVVFYSAKNGRFGMGSFDMTTKRVRYYDPTPDIDWFAGREATWITNESFVYSAYAGGGAPMHGWRRGYGEHMEVAWKKTWRGKEASVTAVESRAVPDLTQFEAGQLLQVDARTGAVTRIAAGMYRDIHLSHDGRYLAALRQARRVQPDPGKPDRDETTNRSQLVLFDLQKKGDAIVVSPQIDVFPKTLAWAADANRLAYFGWPIGGGMAAGRFRAVDAGTGEVKTYAHKGLDLVSQRERGLQQKPERVWWIGDRLAMFARENQAGDLEPKLTYLDRSGRDRPAAGVGLFLVDEAGGHENLTRQFKSVSTVPLYGDATTIYLLADGGVWRLRPGEAALDLTEHAARNLSLTVDESRESLNRPFNPVRTLLARSDAGSSVVSVDFRTSRVTEVSGVGPGVEPLAMSARSGAVLYRDQVGAGEAIMLRRGMAAPFVLHRLNPHIDAVARSIQARISYEVATGSGMRKVDGCVLLPPDYQEGRRYPVVVDVYPGRGAASCNGPGALGPTRMDNWVRPNSEHMFAANGFIYFKPDLTRDVIRRPEGPLAGMTDATLRGVQALVDAGYADTDRVGLFGLSQGGFSSLWVTTQTDRFKAAVSANGWADMYWHFYEALYAQRAFPDGYPYKGSTDRYLAVAGQEFGLGKTPQQDIDLYIRNSPLFQSDKITTPLLLVHSDLDIFNLSHYEAMFTSLYQQRKEARLLQYWGEGHSPSSPANIRDLWREMIGWYDKYLDITRDASGALRWNGDRVQGR